MISDLHSRDLAAFPCAPLWSGDKQLQAARQENRPLRIALLNLMPDKPVTERHFAKAFAAALHPLEWVLTLPEGYRSTTTPLSYLERYYTPWSALDLTELDGLIVTGAPLEHLPFDEVRYWSGLTRAFDEARSHGVPCLFICWAAQAALSHFHGVEKHILPKKRFGVFAQEVVRPNDPLLAGLGSQFYTPVSRHGEIRRQDLPGTRGLEVLAESPDSGICLLAARAEKFLFMFNHLEYEADTLSREYARDHAMGILTAAPVNTRPQRQSASAPMGLWAGTAERFFANWSESLTARSETIDLHA